MPRRDVPALRGVVSAADVLATAAAIARAQERTGAIPWYPGGHTDPWDHVECAMALSAAGFDTEAVAAYEWLRRTQRRDGSWPAKTRQGIVEEARSETNQCAYVAVGVWHHLLVTGDERFAVRMWPVVGAATDLVVRHQTDRGEIRWAVDAGRRASDEALLTGSSSTYQSLRCALALADWMGEPQPEWELAAGRLAHVVAEHDDVFLDKRRYSMDWYYPVLGGAVRGADGHVRIARQWDEFVVAGLGARCVSDEPWVTGAETCELALALDALGDRDRATAVVAAMQHMRDADGSYWTGYQFDLRINWPDEHTTWTGAAVILAADALSRTTPGNGIFRADLLPVGVDLNDPVCGCAPAWLERGGAPRWLELERPAQNP